MDLPTLQMDIIDVISELKELVEEARINSIEGLDRRIRYFIT